MPTTSNGVDDMDSLEAICAYALQPGGKMLRPKLLLAAARVVGGRDEQVQLAGVAAEYGHVASLIHDDIIDGDVVRRGRESVMARYGVGQAVVAGDYLIFALFHVLSRCRGTAVLDDRIVSAVGVFATVGMDLCRGQHAEFGMSGLLDCTVEDYMAMVSAKTAALFRGACQAGAILAGGDQDQIEALAKFGHHLGVEFQIIDDLLPYVGVGTGKDRLSDVRNRRPTLPVILAAEASSPGQRTRLGAILAGELTEQPGHDELGRLLAETGAIEAAHRVADQHARLASKALDVLPPSPSRDQLGSFVDLVINRKS